MMANQLKGNLYIVAAPSGGGKTSLVKKLVDALDDIEVSISHTTRPKRPGEQDGVDYFFVDDSAFQSMIQDDLFVEYASVFDHFYGTSIEQIQNRLRLGIDIVLDIDWQGAQQIRHLFPDVVSIFILPPSLEVLKHRLTNRKQDNEQTINERMAKAQEEMSHYGEFDYLIVNDNFADAALELQAIVISNRLKMGKQSIKQAKLLSFLLSSN